MFFESLLQDLRIGFRVLLKEKSFCALAVFVLALGIGGVTTQFSVVNGVMLAASPIPMPTGWPGSRLSTSRSRTPMPTASAARSSRSISRRCASSRNPSS
jgi:hypothetical protein